MKSAAAKSLPVDLSARFDHLLAARWQFSRSATRVTVPGELPAPLELAVLRLGAGQEWRAYSGDFRTYCAIGRTGGASADRFMPVLQVCFLDCDASVYAAGLWYHDRERGWKVHDVHDMSPTPSWRQVLHRSLH